MVYHDALTRYDLDSLAGGPNCHGELAGSCASHSTHLIDQVVVAAEKL